MSVDYRIAPAILTLRAEVNAAYPDRPRQSDGLVGDAAHQQRQSDHNPLPPHAGVVTAWDCTTASFTVDLAEQFRLMGAGGDGRPKYVIYRGRITGPEHGWQWAPYSGESAHFDHIHLSVSDNPAQYDRTDPWNVFSVHAQDASKPAPIQEEDMPHLVKDSQGGTWVVSLDLSQRHAVHGATNEKNLLASGFYKQTEMTDDQLASIKLT